MMDDPAEKKNKAAAEQDSAARLQARVLMRAAKVASSGWT